MMRERAAGDFTEREAREYLDYEVGIDPETYHREYSTWWEQERWSNCSLCGRGWSQWVCEGVRVVCVTYHERCRNTDCDEVVEIRVMQADGHPERILACWCASCGDGDYREEVYEKELPQYTPTSVDSIVLPTYLPARGKLLLHHVQWFDERTMRVCRSCHGKIHLTPGFHDELEPMVTREMYRVLRKMGVSDVLDGGLPTRGVV